MDENGDCPILQAANESIYYMLPESTEHATCVIVHAELNGDSVAYNFLNVAYKFCTAATVHNTLNCQLVLLEAPGSECP